MVVLTFTATLKIKKAVTFRDLLALDAVEYAYSLYLVIYKD